MHCVWVQLARCSGIREREMFLGGGWVFLLNADLNQSLYFLQFFSVCARLRNVYPVNI